MTQQKVVLLHGIWRTSKSMVLIARHLRKQGYAVLNLTYPSTKLPLEALVEEIHAKIAAFAEGATTHFVGHSMGGLLIRAYLTLHRPPTLGKVVMLGTPNHGSEVADFLKDWWLFRRVFGPAGKQLITNQGAIAPLFGPVDYPLGIIAGIARSMWCAGISSVNRMMVKSPSRARSLTAWPTIALCLCRT